MLVVCADDELPWYCALPALDYYTRCAPTHCASVALLWSEVLALLSTASWHAPMLLAAWACNEPHPLNRPAHVVHQLHQVAIAVARYEGCGDLQSKHSRTTTQYTLGAPCEQPLAACDDGWPQSLAAVSRACHALGAPSTSQPCSPKSYLHGRTARSMLHEDAMREDV